MRSYYYVSYYFGRETSIVGVGSNGMLLASNTSGLCKMWTGELKGFPVGDGDCEHLREQLGGLKECVMGAGEIFWCAGMLVHESYPAKEPVRRQLIRITLPNTSAWFDGYTANPLGIKPNGLVLSEKRI